MDQGKIIKHYDKIDSQVRKKKARISYPTAKGFFIPSSLVHMNIAFSKLSKIIKKSRPFLDAGCGDARVMALASMFGYAAYGIEYEKDIAENAKKNLKKLNLFGMVEKGDFLDDKTYLKLGAKFEDFGTIFNFANSCIDLAEKIAKESKPGVIFLFYDTSKRPTEFKGLDLIKSLILKDEDKIKNYNPKSEEKDLPLLINYLHIYTKKRSLLKFF